MSYRSAIFYTSDEQKRIAEDTIADVDASGLWPGKVVTEFAPAGDFWEAEPEHQDYLERYSERLYLPFRPARLEAAASARRGEEIGLTEPGRICGVEDYAPTSAQMARSNCLTRNRRPATWPHRES